LLSSSLFTDNLKFIMSRIIQSKTPKTVNFLGLRLTILENGIMYLKFLKPLIMT